MHETDMQPDGHMLSRTASNQSARAGLDSPLDGHGVSSALSRPGVPRESSVSARTSQVCVFECQWWLSEA